MPHSVPRAASPLTHEPEDLPDAPAKAGSEEKEGAMEGPMDGVVAPHSPSEGDEKKPDVKLEDLFANDDDDDEEFPSSSASDFEPKSSPPTVPV